MAYRSEQDRLGLAGERPLTQLRFCVERGSLVINDMTVVFANGPQQDVPLRLRFQSGQCSRAIDLRGDIRHLDKILMAYETQPGAGPKASVVFEDRRAGLGPVGLSLVLEARYWKHGGSDVDHGAVAIVDLGRACGETLELLETAENVLDEMTPALDDGVDREGGPRRLGR